VGTRLQVRTKERTITAISQELGRIDTTRVRLGSIRYLRVIEVDVYGTLSKQPEQLTENLARWLLHPKNRVIEQLAMAPEDANDHALIASIYGHSIGAPYILDIDSII
jgi:hypothetical protein